MTAMLIISNGDDSYLYMFIMYWPVCDPTSVPVNTCVMAIILHVHEKNLMNSMYISYYIWKLDDQIVFLSLSQPNLSNDYWQSGILLAMYVQLLSVETNLNVCPNWQSFHFPQSKLHTFQEPIIPCIKMNQLPAQESKSEYLVASFSW